MVPQVDRYGCTMSIYDLSPCDPLDVRVNSDQLCSNLVDFIMVAASTLLQEDFTVHVCSCSTYEITIIRWYMMLVVVISHSHSRSMLI